MNLWAVSTRYPYSSDHLIPSLVQKRRKDDVVLPVKPAGGDNDFPPSLLLRSGRHGTKTGTAQGYPLVINFGPVDEVDANAGVGRFGVYYLSFVPRPGRF